MRTCAVFSCKNKGVYTFPNDENLKRQWIKAAKIDVQRKIGWNLRKYSCVCSDHFIPSDFEKRGNHRRLKRIAVPSIFPWTSKPLASPRDIVQKEVSRDLSPQDLLEYRVIAANIDNNYSNSNHLTTHVEKYLSQDEITFNPANALKTYSRSDPPTTFVEEYSTLNIDIPQDDMDPLLISSGNENTEF